MKKLPEQHPNELDIRFDAKKYILHVTAKGKWALLAAPVLAGCVWLMFLPLKLVVAIALKFWQ
jgi:hypothetical protein